MAPGERVVLDPQDLDRMLRDGEVDTVLCALPDLWGRLVGKRVAPRAFRRILNEGGGVNASLYLFVVDMDMEPLPGFALTDWDRGFQDFLMLPDLSTLRLVPWLERTALVLCDAVIERTGEPVEVSPRQILKRQIRLAADQGLAIKCGSELEVFFFTDGYRDAWARQYRELRPLSDYRADYHLLQTTRDEWLIKQIRLGMEAAGVPIEFSKGEWGLGQHEINMEYADALEMADRHVIYKHGIKEIAALSGLSATFMAKWSQDEVGSSFHIHSSLWDEADGAPLSWDLGDSLHVSKPFRHYLGGLVGSARELSYLFAPYVNSYRRYRPDSFAPTTITWGEDNRTCAFRLVGEGASFRIEDRIPGADANPYLAFAATIAGGLSGIAQKTEPPPITTENAYRDRAAPCIPESLEEAVAEFERSELARSAFGAAVHTHLSLLGKHEAAAFRAYLGTAAAAASTAGGGPAQPGVTEWELRRYFERG
jgi:glutamine synthetase